MRRALGRGLSQLIAEEFESEPREAAIDTVLPNPRQPRTVFDQEALEELANSIREHGVLQPLVVRPTSEGFYELIAGERRLRAAKLAGVKKVPIVVRYASNQDSLEIAVIENVQREDIGPMERARAYKRLMEEFELTQEQVSQKVGKARASVANTLRLMKLPEPIQEGLDKGLISEGHAKALLGIDGAEEQLAHFDRILKEGLNVRETERVVRPQMAPPPPARAVVHAPRVDDDPNLRALEDQVATYLGSPVHLQKSGQTGKLTIDFYSDDDLIRILEKIGFSG